MNFFWRLIISVAAFGIGYVALTGTLPIVRIFGKMPLAEQYAGQGSTYLAWKLIGIALMAFAVLYLLGFVHLW